MKQEIGSLLHLYLDEIDSNLQTEAHDFLINGAAQALQQTDGRNWIPVIVKQTGSDAYEVLANSFIFAAAKKAGLTKVWCIVADHTESTQNLAQILAQETICKIDLATATRDEIKTGLDYLIKRSHNPLKKVKLATATERIYAAPRQYWKQDLSHVPKLKCGITKSKNLQIFKDVFFVTPQPLPEVITDVDFLKTFTNTELKAMAKKRGFSGYSSLNKTALVKLLSAPQAN